MAAPGRPILAGWVEGMCEMALWPKKPGLGGQVQVGVPQVNLLGHEYAVETSKLVFRDYWPEESQWRWLGPGLCTTCASSRPWGCNRDPKFVKRPLCSCHVSRLWGMSQILWHVYLIIFVCVCWNVWMHFAIRPTGAPHQPGPSAAAVQLVGHRSRTPRATCSSTVLPVAQAQAQA